MQDEDKENDADRCKKCHNAINGIANPPAEGEAPNQGTGGAGGTAVPPSSNSGGARVQQSGFQTSAAGASNNQLFDQASSQAQ